MPLLTLHYGAQRTFSCELADSRLLKSWPAPPPCETLSVQAAAALANPLDFQPLSQLFVPGDHVVLAVDRHTPQAATLIATVWNVLRNCGFEPHHVTILQPVGLDLQPLTDPRSHLPAGDREKVQWVVHDPTDEKQRAYLATTAQGERIYLSRVLLEAEVIVSIGTLSFDPVIGYRGTSSIFFPGMSSTEVIQRSHAVGHSELGPDDERPLRQVIDEVAWLLGSQFSVQVIAARGDGVSEILAGANDAVLRRGKELLAQHWRVETDQRADIVVAAIDVDAAGHGWDQLGAALATARNLVVKGGKIVILSEIEGELDQGLELLRDTQEPRNAIQPIRKLAPRDLIPATELARAADWAQIYLLSKLNPDVVDDLFMIPLDDAQQTHRLLAGEGTCVFLEGAQHVYGRVRN